MSWKGAIFFTDDILNGVSYILSLSSGNFYIIDSEDTLKDSSIVDDRVKVISNDSVYTFLRKVDKEKDVIMYISVKESHSDIFLSIISLGYSAFTIMNKKYSSKYAELLSSKSEYSVDDITKMIPILIYDNDQKEN